MSDESATLTAPTEPAAATADPAALTPIPAAAVADVATRKKGRPKGSKNRPAVKRASKPAPKAKVSHKKKVKKPAPKVRAASNLSSIARDATTQALAPLFAATLRQGGPFNSYQQLYDAFRSCNPSVQMGFLAFRRVCRDVGVGSSHRLDATPGSPLFAHLHSPVTARPITGTQQKGPPSHAAYSEGDQNDIPFDNETPSNGPAPAPAISQLLAAAATPAPSFGDPVLVST